MEVKHGYGRAIINAVTMKRKIFGVTLKDRVKNHIDRKRDD